MKILLVLGALYILFAVNVNAQRVYVPLQFNSYSAPCFTAERGWLYHPQHIYTRTLRPDGWAQIEPYECGTPRWIYVRADRFLIERPMGLFDEPGGAHMGTIDPQIVLVRARQYNWLQIETWIGPLWVNLDYRPSTADLDTMLRNLGWHNAVYFRNMEHDIAVQHNTQRTFFSASVPKASFALYIYLLAENGYVCLDEEITFTGADFHGGSGRIRHLYPVGTQITRRELLRLNLMYSDNIATNMLMRVHGVEGYRQFVASLGGNPASVRASVFNSRISGHDVGLFARAIFEYIESNARYASEFRQHLLDNQYKFITHETYEIASKTGWTTGYAWHDMAIIYAESPFILIILSERAGWQRADYVQFAQIAEAFAQWNATWFPPIERAAPRHSYPIVIRLPN
jgi:beta-lactamase class A